MRSLPPLALLLFVCTRAEAQSAVDPRRVDDAIRKGVEFLKTQPGPAAELRSNELLLWTFVHAGVSESDPGFQERFRTMMAAKLETTYATALQAMILEELDRVRYQGRIHACAQFLVDNQCGNGQWSYGTPGPVSTDVPSEGKRMEISTGGARVVRQFDPAAPRVKPDVVRKLPVKRTRTGPPTGDNSNSQYAALGLRACHDAGVLIPKDVLALAKKGWQDSQQAAPDKAGGGVATGEVSAPARGWCYCPHAGHAAYGSMTAGAVGSLSLLDYMTGTAWKRDPAVNSGLAWLAKSYSVTENVGPCEHGNGDPLAFHYYYLYGLERAAVLYGVDKIGGHDYYLEGATLILGAQRGDGSWKGASEYAHHRPMWDTCFAILFLRRATRPLDVVSEDRFHKR